ncbi:MAG: InlB B-repeat-containing protein [Dehalococcoidales bacterium]|nr:InlB B-repeat-containing protein [Dehalococcoidales bacterium]
MNVSPTQGGIVTIDEIIPTVYPATKTVSNGTSVVIEAIPAEGYEFTGWSGGLISHENPVTLSMTCNKDITASFSEKKYNLTIDVNGSGTVSPSSGVYSHYEGDAVNITAFPNTGYRFDGWTGDVSNIGSASTTVTMDADKTVVANFSRVVQILTININGSGSVTPANGEHSYGKGTAVNLNAVPDAGYRFDGWTGDVSDTSSASTTVTLDGDKTVIANFSRVINTKTLTIEVNGAGSVTPAAGEHRYNEGEVASITATPDTGYRFDSWTGNVSDTGSASTTVTISSDITVTAKFTRINIFTPLVIAGIVFGGLVVIGGISWLVIKRRRGQS